MADTVAITAGIGTAIATDDVSSVHYQRVKRSVGADGSATDFLDKSSRSDTFTASGNGTTVDVSSQGMTKFGLQVVKTGTVSAWNVVLEGSLNGTHFSTILTHTETLPGDTLVIWTGAGTFPALYYRARCVSITLSGGTNVVATIIGKP
jgi:hypothetical protein